jgi:hypothetical protein
MSAPRKNSSDTQPNGERVSPMSTSSRLMTAIAVLACSTAIAGAAFASPSASIEQVRNGVATATTTPTPTWVSGNAGASNSHYLESHSIPYRAVLGDLPTDGTVIELVIAYNVKRSGSYAIDYLTQFQRVLPHVGFSHSGPETFDPLNGITGVGATVTTAAIPVPTKNLMVDPDGAESEPAALQPSTNMNALSSAEKVMTLYGGTLIDVTYVTEGDVALATSSSETQIKVRFTANSPKAVLAWGGHIACRWDWGFNADGTPRSAGGISGSSYHMRLVTWNLGSVGNQDRSMSTDAVYPVPHCGVSNLGPFCAGSTNTHSGPTGMESYSWELFNNTSGASIVGSSTGISVTVFSGNAGGSYSLMLTTGASGFTKSCDGIVTVNTPVIADAGPDQAACTSSPQIQLAGIVTGGAAKWSGGAGTYSPSNTAPNAIYTPTAAEITAGAVTLTLTCTPAVGPCLPASDQVRLSFNRAATVNAGADLIVCSSSPQAQLAGVVGGGATSGTWSGGAGTFSPSASALNATYVPSADEIAAGSVTLTLTTDDPTGPCGSLSDQVKITINPAATVNAGADLVVCSSSPQAQLAGVLGGGAATGTWSGGAGTYSPNASSPTAIYTPTAAEITAGGVTLTFTTNDPAGPCPAVNDQVRITIGRAATVNAGADLIVCSSSPQAQLAGVVGGGAASGTWSGGAGTFSPSASALNATYVPSADEIAAGSVTLTLTTDDPTGPCGGLSDQVKITINPAATVSAGADLVVCSSSPQAQLAGVLGGGAATGTWSGGAGTYSPNASSPTAIYTPTAAEITAGGVTLTLTTNDPAGPCPAVNDQVRININPAATVNAGVDLIVCSSSPQAQLAGVVGGGAASGTWSGGAGTFSPSASTLNATYTPTAAEIAVGGVTLTLTTDDPNGPCGAVSDQVGIRVNPAATANAGADLTVCASSPLTQLAGVLGGGATSGAWTGGAGTYSPNASSPTAFYTPSAAEIAAGGVTLTLTTNDPAGPCPAVNDQVRITINPAATVNAGPDQTVCSSSPQVQLAGIIGGGASSGFWSGGAGTFSPGRSDLNATYTPSGAEIAAGSVTFSLVTNDPAGPCPAMSDAITITINPAATVSAGADQRVCASSPRVQLAGTVGGGASSGTWSGGAGNFNPTASSPTATYTPTAAEIAAGGVTLTLTTNDPAGPCPALNDQMRITIDPITIVNAGPDQTVCASSPQVQLHGSVSGTVSGGTWSGGAGTFSPSNTGLNATYTPSPAEIAAGGVTLTLTSAASSGPCPPASDQMRITIDPAATVNAGADQITCAVSPTVRLSGTIGGAAANGTWSGGMGTYDPNANTWNATYTPTPAEIAARSVTLTFTTNDPAGPCPAVSDQVKITYDQPTVTVPSKAVCVGISPIQLCANVSNGISPYTYRWSNGATTQCISVSDTGSYTVTITDARGCQATGSGSFEWRECPGTLAHTSTTCQQFMDGTASPLLPGDVNWATRNGVISTISPGVFFYFSLAKAPAANFTIDIVQTKSNPAFPFIAVMQSQVSLFDQNCGNSTTGVELSTGQASVSVTGATPGQIFVVVAKYSLKSLVGVPMGPGEGCCFNFRTAVNGHFVDADPNGITVGTVQTCGIDGGDPTGGDTGNGDPNGGNTGGGTDGGMTEDPGFILPGKKGVAGNANITSEAYSLDAYRPVPNPFRDGMRMAYVVGTSGAPVSIRVYDVAGRLVRTLVDGFEPAGRHLATWDGRSEQGSRMTNGVYFVHVRIGSEARQTRVTFLQ